MTTYLTVLFYASYILVRRTNTHVKFNNSVNYVTALDIHIPIPRPPHLAY